MQGLAYADKLPMVVFTALRYFEFYTHHCVQSGQKSIEGVLKNLEKDLILAGRLFTV
jgi:hypothetical protein